jgi:hypothetical protein
MSTYLISAVLRQNGSPLASIEREIESRVTAETELRARRLFLEKVWSRGMLCSAVLKVEAPTTKGSEP